MNNPLAATDPTGYISSICSVGSNENARGCETGSADTSLAPLSDGKNAGSGGRKANGAPGQGSTQADKDDAFSSRISNNRNEKLPSSCKNYALPSSCGGITQDKAVQDARETGKAPTSGKFDSEFINPRVSSWTTIRSDDSVEIRIPFTGDELDEVIVAGASVWSDPKIKLEVSAYRDDSDPLALKVNKIDSAQLSARACLTNCGDGYAIYGNVTNPIKNNRVLMNSDHPSSRSRTETFKHELGHVFFGDDHPGKKDPLYGGTMSYHRTNPQRFEKQILKDKYGN
jgi:hypothetical protein